MFTSYLVSWLINLRVLFKPLQCKTARNANSFRIRSKTAVMTVIMSVFMSEVSNLSEFTRSEWKMSSLSSKSSDAFL